MRKIKELHAFLLSLNLFAAEQMDSAVDNLTVTPCCRPHTVPGQLVVAEKDYTAAFLIERYPHHLRSDDELIAPLSVFLLNHDPERTEKVVFKMDIDLLDNETANIVFSILYTELVLAEEDSNGSLLINNLRYKLL
jgi:hypothetical protein